MPPKKTIAFGKIGSFGQLTIGSPPAEVQKSSNDGFGTFGKSEEFKVESTTDVELAMGFQGFGKNKKSAAQTFDLDSLVEQSKQMAKERNAAKPIPQEQTDEADNQLIGPPLPPMPVKNEMKKVSVKVNKKSNQSSSKNSSEDDEDGSSSDSDDETSTTFIPASLEVNLNHGTKTVSALSVDHSGARLVTGSVDYDVKLWDFAGMSSSLQSFRTIRPCER